MTKSFDYSAPHFEGWEAETKVCPHCKQGVSPLGWWGFGAEGEPSRSVSVSLLGWAIA